MKQKDDKRQWPMRKVVDRVHIPVSYLVLECGHQMEEIYYSKNAIPSKAKRCPFCHEKRAK